MPRTRTLGSLEITDADLAGRAAAGDTGAFEELYRRHAQAAWRVAESVAHNADDAADAVADAFTRLFKALPEGRLAEGGAFRPYLLAATRNAAIDVLRRKGKLVPESPDDLDLTSSTNAGPTELLEAGENADLMAEAFRSLPERWRTVLWMTEVERIPAREAAVAMGLSANGVAQLAVRARAGLRERYLQAHLRGRVAESCAATHGMLGAYVAGALSPRDIAKVDQHLAGCNECRLRVSELEDMSPALRRIAIPFPLALAGLAGAKYAAFAAGTAGAAATGAAGAATGAAGSVGTGLLRDSDAILQRIWRPMLAVTATIGVIGLMVAATRDGGTLEAFRRARPAPTFAAPAPPSIGDDQVINLAVASPPLGGGGGGADAPSGGGFGGDAPSPLPAPPAGPPPAPAPPAPAGPVVNVAASTPVLGLSAGLGDGSCTGVTVAGNAIACPVAPPAEGGTLEVSTDGSILGKNVIGI